MFDNLKDVLHGTLRCNGLGEGDRIYIRSHVPGDGYAARPFFRARSGPRSQTIELPDGRLAFHGRQAVAKSKGENSTS